MKRIFAVLEKKWAICLVINVVIFTTFCVILGNLQSVWFDEAYSINLAKRSVSELLELTAADVHPPLYYLILKGVCSVFGYSEMVMRGVSTVFMAAAVAFMIVLVRKLFGGKTANVVGIFLALAPMLIRYGFEIRMYALATFIAVFSSYVLWKFLSAQGKKRRKFGILYGVLVAMGMYTLYYLVIVFFSQFIYLVYRRSKEKKSVFFADYVIYYSLSVGLFMPWILTAISQFTNGALANISERLTMANLLGIFTFNLVYQPSWATSQIVGAVVLAVIGIFLAIFLKMKKTEELKFLGFLAVGPVVLEFVICLFKPMYVERYLVYFSPFLIAMFGVVFMQAKRQAIMIPFLLAVFLVGVFNLFRVGNYNFQRLQRPNVREVASELRDKKEPVFADSPYEAIELSYYLGETYFYAPWEKLGGGYAVLDGNEKKIEKKEELLKFSCFEYVFYDEKTETREILEGAGFKIEKAEGAEGMKFAKACRN